MVFSDAQGKDQRRKKQAQHQEWMRQRQLALSEETPKASTVSTLANHGIFDNNDASKTFECPICYEWMLPPDRSPMILVPCGHSFCYKCLDKLRDNQHEKTISSKKTACPLCRAHVVAQVLNHSLKHVILETATSRTSKSRASKKSESPTHRQQQPDVRTRRTGNDIRQLALRCTILEDEKQELQDSLRDNLHQLTQLRGQHEQEQETQRKVRDQLREVQDQLDQSQHRIEFNRQQEQEQKQVRMELLEQHALIERSIEHLKRQLLR